MNKILKTIIVFISCMIISFTTIYAIIDNKTTITANFQKENIIFEQDTNKKEVEIYNCKSISNNLYNSSQKQKKKNKPTFKVVKKYSVSKKASTFKTYMSYKCITLKSSPQYKLQHKKSSKTNFNGLRYTKIKGINFIHIALGSYYGAKIGTKYRITLSTGKQFYGILADQKSDCHTNSTHQYTKQNGDAIEFIIDNAKLNKKVRQTGDISSISKYRGKVKKIEKIKLLNNKHK